MWRRCVFTVGTLMNNRSAVATSSGRRSGEAGGFLGGAGAGRAERQTLEGVDPQEADATFRGEREQVVPMGLSVVIVVVVESQDPVGEMHAALDS